ncbi:unnamed protein product [Arabidopsis halleri]
MQLKRENLNSSQLLWWLSKVLYALQLVVLQAVPAIQEGLVSEETGCSESDEETVEIIPRQVVSFKLGNAKDLDVKYQTAVYPIILSKLFLMMGKMFRGQMTK